MAKIAELVGFTLIDNRGNHTRKIVLKSAYEEMLFAHHKYLNENASDGGTVERNSNKYVLTVPNFPADATAQQREDFLSNGSIPNKKTTPKPAPVEAPEETEEPAPAPVPSNFKKKKS